MFVEYSPRIRVKVSEEQHVPTPDQFRSLLTLALMRSEVWLIRELDAADLELTIEGVDVTDFGGFNFNDPITDRYRKLFGS